MLMLYFSGTGNSAYIARQFAERMQAACHCIEENVLFDRLIAAHDTVAFCYPIYGSCVPRIMRAFVAAHGPPLQNKRVIIFCTQMMFSGDGAKALARLLPGGPAQAMYAEHFAMPNNICNFWLFPIREGERRRKKQAADKKLDKACAAIRQGLVRRRGWGAPSRLLGFIQNISWPGIEEKKRCSFTADGDCNRCGLCVKACPVHNLELTPAGVQQQNNCILCYRCVNLCPQRAATVLLAAKPRRQYKGPV